MKTIDPIPTPQADTGGAGRDLLTKTTPDKGSSDEILASQWSDRGSPCLTDVPERRLLLALLADAVRCLQVGGKPRTEVFAWVRGQNAAVRISFRFVCDGLGMEVAPLARRLLTAANAGIQLPRRRRVRVRSHGTVHIVDGHTPQEAPRQEAIEALPAQIPA